MDNYTEDFFKFIEAQPSDKLINHSSWNSCAIGDFLEDLTGTRGEPGDSNTDEILEALEEEEGFIFESLNHGAPTEHTEEYDLSTYGGLSEYIAAFRGLDIDDYHGEYEYY